MLLGPKKLLLGGGGGSYFKLITLTTQVRYLSILIDPMTQFKKKNNFALAYCEYDDIGKEGNVKNKQKAVSL